MNARALRLASIAALTVAWAAMARAGEPAAQAPPAAASPAPASTGDTVSGVTVMPLPKRACAPKDKACIALVVAELKARYPEQLRKFCFQTEMNVQRQDMQAVVNGWCDSPSPGVAALCTHRVPPVLKQACASDPNPEDKGR